MDTTLLGFWLCLVLGLPTTAAAAPNYTHVFKSGGSTLPSDTLELGLPDISQFVLMKGAQGTSLEISAQATGRPTCRVGIVGKTAPRSGTSVDTTPTVVTTFEQFRSFNGTISRNGTELGAVTSFNMTYNNNLDPVRTIGSGEDIDEAPPGGSTLTGTLGVRLKDGVLHGDAEAKTPIALALAFDIDGNADKAITINLPRVYLPRKRFAVQGKGGVQASFDLRGSYDSTLLAALGVTLKNQKVSYA